MNVNGLDETDKKILDIIKDDARLSYSDIGAKIGISRVAVKNHMDAMEKSGIIVGYKTVLDTSNVPASFRFLIDLEVIPEQFPIIVRKLNGSSLIREIYTVSGESKIHAVGMGTNKGLIDRFSTGIYNMYGIKRFGFHMILDTLKDVDGGVDYEQRIKEQENEICGVSEREADEH